jgi:tripartite-type tricarboxylate transporter receptor subunit TctC
VALGGLANIPTLLGVNGDSPIKSVRELIDTAKAKPGALNYASGGAGSPQHLATEMFMAMTGVQLTHIPYKGATQAAAGLAGGDVQVMFIAHSLALPFLGTGKVRPIAFAGGERSAAFPNLPTVAELGVPGFDYSSWIALFAPKGTPVDVVARLRKEVEAATALPEVRERMAKSGLELWAVPADRLPAIIRDDFARWERVVKTANIKAD